MNADKTNRMFTWIFSVCTYFRATILVQHDNEYKNLRFHFGYIFNLAYLRWNRQENRSIFRVYFFYVKSQFYRVSPSHFMKSNESIHKIINTLTLRSLLLRVWWKTVRGTGLKHEKTNIFPHTRFRAHVVKINSGGGTSRGNLIVSWKRSNRINLVMKVLTTSFHPFWHYLKPLSKVFCLK